jgi:bifunctional non-homologous end joining protein LigD
MNPEKLLSHPDKVFWPEEGYTKLDLARFYETVFPKLKPYVEDRMLSLERCPDGMSGQCFYQKQAPKGLPPATPTKLIHHEKKDVNYVLGGTLETEIALVNFGCIPVHVWGSRASQPQQPDWMVFDLDPGSGGFADAAKASSLCDRLAAAHPDTLTVEARIKARKDRVYLDSFRNGFGATVVAPYSVRRREKAPFSMPLAWKEVKPGLSPAAFNLSNYKKRLAGGDAWEGFFESRQSLKGRS